MPLGSLHARTQRETRKHTQTGKTTKEMKTGCLEAGAASPHNGTLVREREGEWSGRVRRVGGGLTSQDCTKDNQLERRREMRNI